jgi:restriction system protein
VKISDVVTLLGKQLALSEEELLELLPSGKQTTFANRVDWAKSYLGKAGLITLTKRGHFVVSDHGKTVLTAPPAGINIKFLDSFPEFKQFREANGPPAAAPQAEAVNLKDLTPDEVIRSAYGELHQALSSELMAKILSAPPTSSSDLSCSCLLRWDTAALPSKPEGRLGRAVTAAWMV